MSGGNRAPGLKLSSTRPWQKQRWRRLKQTSRQHLLDLALDKPIVFYGLMADLGFSMSEAKEIKQFRLEGGLIDEKTGGTNV